MTNIKKDRELKIEAMILMSYPILINERNKWTLVAFSGLFGCNYRTYCVIINESIAIDFIHSNNANKSNTRIASI